MLWHAVFDCCLSLSWSLFPQIYNGWLLLQLPLFITCVYCFHSFEWNELFIKKKGQLSWYFVLFARCRKKQDKCFTLSLKKVQLHVWKRWLNMLLMNIFVWWTAIIHSDAIICTFYIYFFLLLLLPTWSERENPHLTSNFLE